MFHTVCCGHIPHILEIVRKSAYRKCALCAKCTKYCGSMLFWTNPVVSEHTVLISLKSKSCQHSGNPSSVVFTPLVRNTHMLRNGWDFCVQGHIQSSQGVFESQLHTPYRPNMLLLIDWTSHPVRRPQHGGNTSLSAGYQLVEGAAGSD